MTTLLPTNSRESFKTSARLLLDWLRSNGMDQAGHPKALDALSAAHGVRDWNTMSALLSAIDGAGKPIMKQAGGTDFFPGPVNAVSWLSFLEWSRSVGAHMIFMSPDEPIRATIRGKGVRGIVIAAAPSTDTVNSISETVRAMATGWHDRLGSHNGCWSSKHPTVLHDIPNPSGNTGRLRTFQQLFEAGGRICISAVMLGGLPPTPKEMSVDEDIISNFRPSRSAGGVVILSGFGYGGTRAPNASGVDTLAFSLLYHRCVQAKAHEKVISLAFPSYIMPHDFDFPTSHMWQVLNGQYEHEVDDDERLASIDNAMRMKPTILDVGNMRGKGVLEKAVTVSQLAPGLLVMGRMSIATSVARLLFLLRKRTSPAEWPCMLGSIRMLVCQKSAHNKSGTVETLEHLVLNDARREVILSAGEECMENVVTPMLVRSDVLIP